MVFICLGLNSFDLTLSFLANVRAYFAVLSSFIGFYEKKLIDDEVPKLPGLNSYADELYYTKLGYFLIVSFGASKLNFFGYIFLPYILSNGVDYTLA